MTTNNDERRQNVAICVILAITLVEAFLNLFFRVIASEPEYGGFSQTIFKDLKEQASLDHKIKVWPKLVFRESINFGNGVGKEFLDLKNMRNWLMHFNSPNETFRNADMTIEGLVDISKYEALDVAYAEHALDTAVGIITEIIKLSGIQPKQVPTHLQFWLGKLPTLS